MGSELECPGPLHFAHVCECGANLPYRSDLVTSDGVLAQVMDSVVHVLNFFFKFNSLRLLYHHLVLPDTVLVVHGKPGQYTKIFL